MTILYMGDVDRQIDIGHGSGRHLHSRVLGCKYVLALAIAGRAKNIQH